MRNYFVVTAALGALLLAAGCGRQAETTTTTQADNRTPVNLARATTGAIAQTQQVTGGIEALRDVNLTAKLPGRITTVLVKEGDPVRRGQPVVQQDASDLLVQRNQAQAGLNSAVAQREQAKAAVEAARAQLAQASTTANYQPEQTDAQIQAARAQLRAAQAQLSAIRSGARPQEREQARQNVEAAQANLTRAQADVQRARSLANQGAVPRQQLDAAEAAFRTAQAQYNQAREALNLIQEGARREDIEAAEQQVRQAEEQLRLARAGKSVDIIRTQQVSGARAQLAQAQGQVAAAQAAIDNAKAQIRLLNQQIADMTVRSSIDGVVAERMAQPGQTGQPGSPLLRIVDLSSVVFEGNVSETQLANFKQGQNVTVRTPAFANRAYVGRIERVYPAGNTQSRNFIVRVAVNNSDNSLRPGMFARGEVVVRRYVGVTLVPKDAVVQVGEETWVFTVVDGEKAKKQPVKVVVSDQNRAMVTGVSPGQSIVVRGQNNLQEGTLIRTQ